MARTEAEKYTVRRAQREDGSWYSFKELNRDARYCDLCDSEDVERTGDLVTVDGWYGGIEILWASRGGVHGPQIVTVLCRSCRQQHYDAYWSAERRAVEVDCRREFAYYCPAHKSDHYEDAVEIERREAQYAELREVIR